MTEQLWITTLLNHWFAGPANSVLGMLHIHPQNPQAPIDNTFAMEFLVFVLLMVFFMLVRASLSVDRPGALQHIVEGAEGFIENQSDEIIGHGSKGFTPFLMALGLFILLNNLIGLVPGFEPCLFLACADRHPGAFPGTARLCVALADLHFCFDDDDLPFRGSRRRALEFDRALEF